MQTCEPKYLTVATAATVDGFSPATLKRWCAAGRLSAFKPAGRLLLPADELEALVRSAAVPPAADTHAEGAGGVDE